MGGGSGVVEGRAQSLEAVGRRARGAGDWRRRRRSGRRRGRRGRQKAVGCAHDAVVLAVHCERVAARVGRIRELPQASMVVG